MASNKPLFYSFYQSVPSPESYKSKKYNTCQCLDDKCKKILNIEGTTNSNLAAHFLKEENRLINRLNRFFSPARFKFKLDLLKNKFTSIQI